MSRHATKAQLAHRAKIHGPAMVKAGLNANTKKSRTFRQRMHDEQCFEVRGIWAALEDHEMVKDRARLLVAFLKDHREDGKQS